jgi:hypothetical protein
METRNRHPSMENTDNQVQIRTSEREGSSVSRNEIRRQIEEYLRNPSTDRPSIICPTNSKSCCLIKINKKTLDILGPRKLGAQVNSAESHTYTRFTTFLIFLEFSNARVDNSFAEELSFTSMASILCWTSAGRKASSTLMVFAAAKLLEKFLRLSNVRFPCPTT